MGILELLSIFFEENPRKETPGHPPPTTSPSKGVYPDQYCFVRDRKDLSKVAGYSSISGDLIIREEDKSIDGLPGLESIREVGGNLIIDNMFNEETNEPGGYLTDLSGLCNIERVDGDIMVVGNKNLADMTCFVSIVSVGGRISVRSNPDIGNVIFYRLSSVAGGISVENNWSIREIVLPSLASTRSIWVDYAPNAERVLLPKLEDIESISLRHMKSLTNISLSCLETIGRFPGTLLSGESAVGMDMYRLGKLEIRNCASLTSLSALSTVKTVYGDMRILDNRKLDSLAGMYNKKVHGHLAIAGNPSLRSLSGMENLHCYSNVDIVKNHPSMEDSEIESAVKTILKDREGTLYSKADMFSENGVWNEDILTCAKDLGIDVNDFTSRIDEEDADRILNRLKQLSDGEEENPSREAHCIIEEGRDGSLGLSGETPDRKEKEKRIFQIAKETGVPTEVVLECANLAGIEVHNYMSKVSYEGERKIKIALNVSESRS